MDPEQLCILADRKVRRLQWKLGSIFHQNAVRKLLKAPLLST